MIKKTILSSAHSLLKESSDALLDGNEGNEGKIIDEELLIRRAFDTDPQSACKVLFQKYYRILCSHAVRFVHSREVAEDLVGEIFCKFWTDQLYLTVNTSYRAYLFKAVRHSAYNYIRWELNRGQRTIDIDDLKFSISANKPEQALLFTELASQIEIAIENLPPQCKKVFIMSRFEQKKYSEISSELGISIKAVEANMSRALEALRKSLEASGLLTLALLFLFL